MLTIEGFKQALRHAQSEIEANKDTLTDLDRAIGDGDHGINMSRGFDAVVAILDDEYASLGELSKKVGMTLMSKVGGAAGPLYGSAFVKAAPKFGDATEADFALVKEALEEGTAAIKARGKSTAGQKTMVDVWEPFLDGLSESDDFTSKLDHLVNETEGMLATKGRASYFGENSRGTIDPGALSSSIVLKAIMKEVD
ncbi:MULTISPECIES: dihydroxyacetone kinase subunit DhaL [unclassified Exiguobacterium]|uniref:dihydroxyacetone kinase subunit DhaL n=1 Tax=unclassified Exiguobacterium TaxID=2644629 RepID=UPI0008D7D6DA|nr:MULTISPECIES: dihydroxyacetone kinase subunit DhaL [unclassified Exiguobacterium]OGX80094.1 dihydroxyacetone kinase subunit L [Exiguobacterium sp. SH31]TCI39457.1 dihydroxyacetone kinase subunit L [Exiguobacterium sp. SH4S7]TCI47847.1 dihydroxyacetone kinase subunit L [Exiguobacterium sp. SH5S32]TCI54731.1 dihydroxyacetone kinase subunit L [Exiguobacterium sp. SH1S4]TCI61582.1 dihydroxyacetone kinase subunit L [Exiguobacterium sp. SH0S2]